MYMDSVNVHFYPNKKQGHTFWTTENEVKVFYDIVLNWKVENIYSGILIVFDVLEITVLFFLFYPNYWLRVSLLWLGIHFFWQAVPNLSATDLVGIILGQKWDSNAETQWKAGPLWSGGQCA